MKIEKTASGKSIVKLSQKEWEDFGKKAGWMSEEGDVKSEEKEAIEASLEEEEAVEASTEVVEASAEAVEDSPEVVEASPTTAPPKEAPTKPTERPTQKPKKRRFPNITPNEEPVPKGEEEEETRPDNLPTIASELAKLKKKVASNPSWIKLAADYNESVHGYTKNFWENVPADHPFAQNPFLREHGDSLSRGSFDYITRVMEEKGIEVDSNIQSLYGKILGLLQEINQAEQGHQDELGELAKQIVSEEWNIDREMLDAQFMDQPGGSGNPQQKEGEMVPITPDIRDEINKRVILNTVSQGAGLHALQSMHHLGAEKLNEISPNLLSLYDEFSNLITQHYFYIDLEMIMAMSDMMSNAGTGWAHTEYSEEGENPTVKAQGMNFTILCQELVKGVVGMATDHGLDNESRKGDPLSEEEKRTILNNADRIQDEPLLIMIGPELWRKFLETMPEGADKFDMVSEISGATTVDVQSMVDNVVSNPDVARQELERFKQELDQFDMVDRMEEEEAELDNVPDDEFNQVGPEFDGAETPDDWGDIQNQLGDLFTQPNQPDRPPVKEEEEDDEEEGFHLPWA